MIPPKFRQTARAQYLCNVYEFIGLGEGKPLTALEVCRIKSDYQDVEQWFEGLGKIAQLRVMKYLVKHHDISARPLPPHFEHHHV